MTATISRLLPALCAALGAVLWWNVVQRGTGDALVLTAVLIAVGAARPDQALLVVAGLAPLGGALAALTGSRVSWTDPLLLAATTGWLIHRTIRPRPLDRTATALTLLYAAAALVSFGVLLVALTHATTPPGAAADYDVWRILRHRHPLLSHPLAPDAPALVRALGGAGVFLLAVETAMTSPATAGRAVRLLAFAIAGTAILNINRLFEIALRQPDTLSTLIGLQRRLRITTTFPDPNAAGALFLLAIPTAAAAVMRPGRARLFWAGCLVLLLAGVWLSGSRTVLVTVPAVLTAILVMPTLDLTARRRWWLLAGLVAAVALIWSTYPRWAAHGRASTALEIRVELLKTTGRMLQDSPLFGVGLGKYYERSGEYATEGLRKHYRVQNAHNQIAQVFGELGITGGLLFVALLMTALAPAAAAIRTGQAGPLVWQLLIAVTGFLIASLTMHPLLVSEVNAAFWIATGLLRGVARPAREPDRRRVAAAARWMVPVAVGLLMASTPGRVEAELSSRRLAGHAVGLSRWRTDPVVGRYRVGDGPIALYIREETGTIRLPLRIRGASAPAEVTVSVDRKPISSVIVPPGEWRWLTLTLPDRQQTRRVDVRWSGGTRLDVGAVRASSPERAGVQ